VRYLVSEQEEDRLKVEVEYRSVLSRDRAPPLTTIGTELVDLFDPGEATIMRVDPERVTIDAYPLRVQHPLTHHEILTLMGPFTARGLHADMAASRREARVLAFTATDIPAARHTGGTRLGADGGEVSDAFLFGRLVREVRNRLEEEQNQSQRRTTIMRVLTDGPSRSHTERGRQAVPGMVEITPEAG